MAIGGLTTYWIISPIPHSPLGFGVTAWSFDEALRIIRALGYGEFLPEDLGMLMATEGITVAELEHPHMVANRGPIVVRGVWYRFVAVGVPDWSAAG